MDIVSVLDDYWGLSILAEDKRKKPAADSRILRGLLGIVVLFTMLIVALTALSAGDAQVIFLVLFELFCLFALCNLWLPASYRGMTNRGLALVVFGLCLSIAVFDGKDALPALLCIGLPALCYAFIGKRRK